MLGAPAASLPQITSANGHVLVYLGDRWFQVIGIMRSALVDSSLDSDVWSSPV